MTKKGMTWEAQVSTQKATLYVDPQLYRQLQTQLSQCAPKDQRHLYRFCENVAAILQAQSAILPLILSALQLPGQ